ncbi:MAG: MoaD/ThiS family protein [Xanthomonadales bacterium]|nr:MoaD/ThiS family protein [Xanthomonadales bacterium]
MRVRVRYYAALREAAGRDEELIESEAADAEGLLHELRARHGFAIPRAGIRLARNGQPADWSAPLADGDRIELLPPYSGL